jgi:hypothetical protein
MASEAEIHKAICLWLDIALPDGCLYHHSPNEGRHRVQYRMKQKRMGMRAGWPDLEIFVNPTWWKDTQIQWSPIFLEVKAEKGRLSDNQKVVIEELTEAGCHVFVVRSIDDAREALSKLVRLRDG